MAAKQKPTNKAATTKPAKDSNTLRVTTSKGDQSHENFMAEIAYDPAARALNGARKFIAPFAGEQPLTESLDALMAQVKAVQSGDMRIAEKTLVVQANTLDAIFNELARRAALNMGEYMEATERYMRLALKAQSQCRATLETLATIKNPPIVYAKQANFANGHQQVNNGVTGQAPAAAPAHAKENEILQNKLLEQQHGNFMDTGTAGTAAGVDSTVEALGEKHRAKVI